MMTRFAIPRSNSGRKRSCFQIFLVFQTRLTEMHLTIDHAGQDVQARAIDHLVCGYVFAGVNLGDAPIHGEYRTDSNFIG